jgi:hypothetical protein
MKLDKDMFPVNMNMVELKGKKVMVRPSQAEPTKGKEVVIREERQSRMIKTKSPKDSQWKENENSKSQQHPKATFDIVMTKYKEGRADIRERDNWTIRFRQSRMIKPKSSKDGQWKKNEMSKS